MQKPVITCHACRQRARETPKMGENHREKICADNLAIIYLADWQAPPRSLQNHP
jgi:hypothetical protein